jgi:hypothetical protein
VGGPDIRATLTTPSRIALLEAVRGRLTLQCELPAPILSDAKLIAAEACQIELAAGLVEDIFARQGASIRSLYAEIERAERLALSMNLTSLNLARWTILTGTTRRQAKQIAPPRAKEISVTDHQPGERQREAAVA